MYHIVYEIVFALDMLLIIFLIGLICTGTYLYWKSRGLERSRVAAAGVGLTGLLVGAIVSLVATSLYNNDPTLFYFPPFFILLDWGILGLVQHGLRTSEGPK